MSKEYASLRPGWLKKDLPKDFYSNTDFLRIYAFFVVFAFKPNRSSNGRKITDYGWTRDVWKNKSEVGLKDVLLYVAGFHRNDNTLDYVTRDPIKDANFVVCSKLDDMKIACTKAGLQGSSFKERTQNRIVVYDSEKNMMMSLFDHIRNALAHGRFYIYEDGMIAMESGKIVYVPEKRKKMMSIRARMLIKKDDLIKWIEIIEKGNVEEDIVKEIEEARKKAKETRKRNRKQKTK